MRGSLLASVLIVASVATNAAFAVDYVLSSTSAVTGLPEQAGTADLTGDGLDDIYCSLNFPPSLVVLTNNGQGAFSSAGSVSLSAGMFGHAAGDFDLDGHVDLAVATAGLATSRLQVFPGNGTGALGVPTVDITTSVTLGPLAAADLNGDGWLDLAVTFISLAPGGGAGVRIYAGGPLGMTQLGDVQTTVPPAEVFIDDLDLDGQSDLVISTAVFGTSLTFGGVEVRYGLGAATFGPAVTVENGLFVGPVRLAHLNGDNRIDLVAATQSPGGFDLRVYWGTSSGGFQSAQTLPYPIGTGVLQVADVDGDNDADLIVNQYDLNTGAIAGYVSLNQNTTFGAIQPVGVSGSYSAWAPVPLELNGSTALVFGNTAAQAVEVYTSTTAGAPEFLRGDTNLDSTVNLGDAVTLLGALFLTGATPLQCDAAGDANDDEQLNLADAITILSRLFIPGSPPLPEPNAQCGIDPTVGGPDCVQSGCP